MVTIAEVTNFKRGTTQVAKIYRGTVLIWPLVPSGLSEYDELILDDSPDAYWPLGAKLSIPNFDDDILASNPEAYWPLNEKRLIAYLDYNQLIIQDDPEAFWELGGKADTLDGENIYDYNVLNDDPKAYWLFDIKDDIVYSNYDVVVLSDDPKAFYILDAVDTGPTLLLDDDSFSDSGTLGSTDTRTIAWSAFSSAVFTEGSGGVRCSTAPMAFNGGNGDIAYTDQGVADCRIHARINLANIDSQRACGVAFRIGSSGANGFTAFIYRTSGGTRSLYVDRTIAGSLVQLVANVGSFGASGFVRLEVTVRGSAITTIVWNDSFTLALYASTLTDTNFQTNTRHGIAGYGGSNSAAYIDQWEIDTLPT